METDFNQDRFEQKSGVIVSTVLKVEIVFAVMIFCENSFDIAVGLGAACVIVNQLTEGVYFKQNTFRRRGLVLFKSLLVTLCMYAVAYIFYGSFTLQRHGETFIDTHKIGVLSKLLAVLFLFLGTVRFLAIVGDRLKNRCVARKSLTKDV